MCEDENIAPTVHWDVNFVPPKNRTKMDDKGVALNTLQRLMSAGSNVKPLNPFAQLSTLVLCEACHKRKSPAEQSALNIGECRFCSRRTLCGDCAGVCAFCGFETCSVCSTKDYQQKATVIVCLDCATGRR